MNRVGTVYRLEEFEFQTEAAYKEAKKEAEVVAYIRQKTDLNNAATVLQLYDKLVVRGTFTTPVGIAFLKELRGAVLRMGLVEENALRPLPEPAVEEVKVKKESKPLTKEQKLVQLYQKRCKNRAMVIVALSCVIAALFCINLFGKNSPFHNYEMEIVNKYAAWADDLTQKQQELHDWENALREQEQRLTEWEVKLQQQDTE